MRDDMGDVVVLVPGFGGSTLERDGRVLWGGDGHAGAASLLALGDDATSLLRLENDDPSRAELADGVRATGIVSGPHLVPGVWRIDGYRKVAQLLGRLFDVEPDQNYVEFAYDWRRDVRASARALARTVEDRLGRWRERTGRDDARVMLLGHSMGAIVARYYLEALDGWKSARALITFGAPFRGAPRALGALTGSSSLGLPTGDYGDLLRSFTSLYQLLPVYPAVHQGEEDEALHRVTEIALPGLDAERVALSLELRRDLDEALQRHNNNPAYREGSYPLVPIVGTAQSTPQSARLTDGTLELLRSYQHRDLSGDGIVPRVAAQPSEAGDVPATLLTAAQHAELQNDDRALSYVLGVFTSLYMGAGPAAPPVRSRIGLDLVLDELVAEGALISVRVHPESAEVPALEATLEHAVSGETVSTVPLAAGGGGWRAGEFPAASAGLYRVRVAGPDGVQSVSDLLEVVPPAALAG